MGVAVNNPFAILNVDRSASKKEILQRVTMAMRSRQHDARSIAEAQKLLFNAVTRAAEEFKQFLDVEPCIDTFQLGAMTTAETPDIVLLDTFNDQAATPRKAR
jgi:hypothetical protein